MCFQIGKNIEGDPQVRKIKDQKLHTFHKRKSVREKTHDNIIKIVNLHDPDFLLTLPPETKPWLPFDPAYD